MENGAGVPNGAAGAPTETPPAALVREQDRLMPIAKVIRIMRRVLPPHAKISDEAKELIQECVSEFISFITGEANEWCHAEHRKTVTAEDVVWAMDRLGLDDYVMPLTVFLQRCGKKTTFPKTKLKRIMRRALGCQQANIDEGAMNAVDGCTLKFADLVTTVAAEVCRKDTRIIVNGDDLIKAMEILGFNYYVGPLDEYLRRYRESKRQVPPPSPLCQPPATAVGTGERQAATPPQPFGFVLDQQPFDVYSVWSTAVEASTSSLMAPARDD